MRSLLTLAYRSLLARRFTVGLTVLTIALSVTLLLGVERLRDEARTSFLRSVAGTDLIVGARAHPVQLLLYSVFRLGDASNNLSWQSAQWIAGLPEVAWSVPISLGDSHRGYRVIGTTPAYFEHLQTGGGRPLSMASGEVFSAVFETVLGADVARELGYQVDSRIVLAHGTGQVTAQKHDDQPFAVVGVLDATGTAIDQGVYVSLAALEAIHLNWRSGTRIGRTPSIDDVDPKLLEPRNVTALFVGLKSRIATFGVQRAVNAYAIEPLSAVLPGVALQQLWSMLDEAERALSMAAACVVAAGFMVLLTTILATLNERRREMAILRGVGASARHVFGLLLTEAALLSAMGATLGALLVELLLLVLSPWLQARYGIFLQAGLPRWETLRLVAAVAGMGTLLGVVPAILAYRRSVQDGMTLKI